MATVPTALSDDVAAVLLAGGFGTRIRHLLADVPKPMAPVAGRPFLEWIVRYFYARGVRRFALSTGYLADVVARHFAANPVLGAEIVCVPEKIPLGTAGGFLNAAAGSGFRCRQWIVANGDSLVLTEFEALLAMTDAPVIAAALLGLKVPDTKRFGSLEVTPEGRLLRFVEKRPGIGMINGGLYVFNAETLALFPQTRPLSFETEVFPALLAAPLPIVVHAVQAPFLDIGTPETLAQASAFVEANESYFNARPT